MKKLSLLLGAFLCVVASAMAQGTTCATAVTVTAGTAAAPANYSAVAATGTGASGLHAAGAGGGAAPAASRWYKYVAATSGNLTISSCGSTTGADTRLWVMTGTCAALVDVAGDDDNCGTPTDAIYLSTLTLPVTAGTTYYFEWDDTWEALAFTWTLAFSSAPAYDARLNSATQEYTSMPATQIVPMVLGGNVTNLGSNALAAAKVTATVFSGTTVVQTYTGTGAALASNASANLVAGMWTPPATPASYTIQYVVSHTNSASDALHTNDTIRYPFAVSADVMARDNNVRAGGLGVTGALASPVKIRQGQEFKMNTAGSIASIDVQMGGGLAGDTIQLEIYTVTAGVVSATPVFTTPIQTLAATNPGLLNVPLATPFAVTAGTTYMVALLHSARGSNIGLGYANSIFTTNKVWIKTSATAAWAHPETLGFPLAYMLRLHLPLAGPDATTIALGAQEYTILPVLEIAPQTLSAKVKNNGTVAGSTTLTVTVTNTTTAAVVYTNTSAAASIAANATQTISCGTWTPPATPGVFYEITYISTVTGDTNHANDTLFSGLGVTASSYARDSGNPVGGLGLVGTATSVTRVIQGMEFAFPNAARIDSVTYLIGGGLVGDSIRAEVYLVTAGVVGAAPVATSAYDVLTATTGGVKTLALSTPYTVTAGATYVVALWHSARGANIALQYDNAIFTTNKNWIKATGVAAGAWTHPEAFGFNMAYILRPNVICPIVTATATTANIISCTTPSVVLTATGGGTYAWSGGGTTATKTVTAAGIYTVTVTTAAGCTATATVTVDANTTPPTATATKANNLTCATPSSVLTATGGGTYAWSGGGTTATKTVTAAGTYTVTVNNTANGCTATATVTVTGSTTLPTATATAANNLTCATPTSVLTATGGGTYAWSGGGTTATKTVTAAGTYTVTVTSANGCTATATVAVTANAGVPTLTVTAPAVLTCTTASTTLTASGTGTSFLWSTGGNTATITVTAAGTYTVTTTATSGCTAATSVTVTANTSAPNASATSANNLTCATPTSVLTATGGGTYAWSGGGTTATKTVTAAGTYTVTVTGANGCTLASSVTVTANTTPPVVSATALNTLTCTNPATELIANGGGTYLWSAGGTTSIIVATAAGTYTVTVTGTNGCTATATVTVISNMAAPAITGTIVGSTGTNGSISTTVTPMATAYLWNNGATTANITNLAAGVYTVTATAVNGCTASASFVVPVINATQSLGNVNNFMAYPNPTNGVLNIAYTLQNVEKVHIELVNALGQILTVKDITAIAQYNEQMDLTAYPSGVYFVKIQTGDTKLTQRITLQK